MLTQILIEFDVNFNEITVSSNKTFTMESLILAQDER